MTKVQTAHNKAQVLTETMANIRCYSTFTVIIEYVIMEYIRPFARV